MAFNKSHLFDPDDQMTSYYAKILGHPARIDILKWLTQESKISVESMLKKYPISRSTLSQHLEILRKANLVHFTEEYPHVLYSLNSETFAKLLRTLTEFSAIFITQEATDLH